MQPSLWLALAGAGVLISFTPGAGAINTMSNSLNSGFRRSMWGILGQQAALVVHILIVALGVGDLDDDSAVVLLAANSTVANKKTGSEGQVRYYRLRLDLVREGDRWLTSNVRFVR